MIDSLLYLYDKLHTTAFAPGMNLGIETLSGTLSGLGPLTKSWNRYN